MSVIAYSHSFPYISQWNSIKFQRCFHAVRIRFEYFGSFLCREICMGLFCCVKIKFENWINSNWSVILICLSFSSCWYYFLGITWCIVNWMYELLNVYRRYNDVSWLVFTSNNHSYREENAYLIEKISRKCEKYEKIASHAKKCMPSNN